MIAMSGGGGGGNETTASGIAFSNDSVPASVEAGLQDSPPPWQPDYNGLSERITALGLPAVGNETFHQHASLQIYDEGKKEPVAANIGVDPATGGLSPLHTHDTSGIIHIEADEEYDFTLGQLMAIWGVKFSDSQIGSLKAKGDQKLQVYLNGKVVKDPVNVIMPEKGNLVIGYGKPGSYPTDPKVDWPQGL